MYTVALHVNPDRKTYAITCRDLDRSLHWVRAGCEFTQDRARMLSRYIYDTRTLNVETPKLFTVIFEGDERAAKNCKASLELMFAGLGIAKETVMPIELTHAQWVQSLEQFN